MSETVSIRTIAATPGALRKSIAEFAAGQMSKREIRDVLTHAMIINPSCGADIQAFIDHEVQKRQMSAKDHKELAMLVTRSLSENVPTETSEDMPNESGLYRVDGEGTLILSGEHAEEGADKVVKGNLKAELQVGAILRERFRLEEEVASGSMGLVYKATDLFKLEAGATAHTIAIKVINPEFANDLAALKSFQNEIANTQLLSHQNIVHLFELDKDGDHYFITMEWLEGESLDMLLDRSKGSALPPIQAYAIIEQLCDALAYAHDRNVVHADVKPGNVFLTKSGELKLIDFGIARLEGPASDADKHQDDSIALTPAYASCECLEKLQPNQQDDLFSLACLVYRLLSGRRVFGASTALQAEVQGLKPVQIGGMSDERWFALSKALSFRRNNRHATIREFAEEFGKRRLQREEQEDLAPAEVAFTETMNLKVLPEGVAFPSPAEEFTAQDHGIGAALKQVSQRPPAAEDTVTENAGRDSLNDTGKLATLYDPRVEVSLDAKPSSGVTKLSPEKASPLEIEVAKSAHMDVQDIGDFPEPINFFDEDSDDSVFMPLETGTGTVPTENSALATVELKVDDLKEAQAESYSVVAETAAKSPVMPALKPKPAPAKQKSSRPAILASQTQRVQKPPAQKLFVGKLLDQIANLPLPVAGSIAAGLAVIAITVGVMNSAEPQASAAALSAPVAIAEPSTLSMVRAAISQVPVTTNETMPVQSAEQSVIPLEQQYEMQVIPRNTADTGIASGRAIVPVELGMPLQVVGPGVAARPLPAQQSAPVQTTTRSGAASVVEVPVVALAKPTAVPVAESPVRATAKPAVAPSVAVPVKATTKPAATPVANLPVTTTTKPAAAPVVAAPVKAPVKPAATAPVMTAAMASVETAKVTAAVNVEPTTGEKLQSLKLQFTAAIAAGRLVEPADDNASIWVAEMRGLDPAAATTRQAQQLLEATLLQRAEQAIAQGNVDKALFWTRRADAAGVSAIQVLEMRRLIAALLVPQETPVVADPSGPKEVTMSELEFTRYVEPALGRKELNRESGWVEVAFMVDAEGRTSDINVRDSNLPEDFSELSMAAVRKWRFEPYLQDGEAIPVKSALRMRFVN